jgi:hypothetical protein
MVHQVHEPAPRVHPSPLLLMVVLRRWPAHALAHGGGSGRLLVGSTASQVHQNSKDGIWAGFWESPAMSPAAAGGASMPPLL